MDKKSTVSSLGPLARGLGRHECFGFDVSRIQLDLVWWLQEENILRIPPFARGSSKVLLFAEAPKNEWEAHLLVSHVLSGWPQDYRELSISFLEFKTILLGLHASRGKAVRQGGGVVCGQRLNSGLCTDSRELSPSI